MAPAANKQSHKHKKQDMGVEVTADCDVHFGLFSRAIAEGMKDFL